MYFLLYYISKKKKITEQKLPAQDESLAPDSSVNISEYILSLSRMLLI